MDKKNYVGYQIKILNNVFSRKLGQELAKNVGEDLTRMQIWILGYIYGQSKKEIPTFQRDIESEFCIARSTATNILQLMVKKGIITKESVDYDDRLKKLVLTEKSDYLIQEHNRTIEEVEGMLTNGLTEDEIKQYIHLTQKMRQNLEQ
ncbi:MAG: MarR family transcriptional regulator [Lachnospiraceae bacterium]|nr:MarR family transcriptional regulator [Lachnospiraceae bacterium]MDD3615699.1 MarR family transcriptional regulator [Lachnospiraceae bacterium]